MTDTLHSVARRMAAAGRLPGLLFDHRKANESDPRIYTAWGEVAMEDDLMCAAIREITKRPFQIRLDSINGCLIADFDGRFVAAANGTTALSVLLAVELACNAAEGGGR